MADMIDRNAVLAKIHWLSNADWTKAERRAAAEIADVIAALPAQGVRPGELRDRIRKAIFDPGKTQDYRGDRTLTEWQTDAVMGILAALEPAEAGGVEEPVIYNDSPLRRHAKAEYPAPVDALVKALHPDQYLEVAEMLIRNEASRDYTQQLVMGLRYLADMIASIREGRG